MASKDAQIGGDHYLKYSLQPWDAYREWLGVEGFVGYLRGNIFSYLIRYKDKGGVEDLKKAMHDLQHLIEVEGERGRATEFQKMENDGLWRVKPLAYTHATDCPYSGPNFEPHGTPSNPARACDCYKLRCVCFDARPTQERLKCPLHPEPIGEYP